MSIQWTNLAPRRSRIVRMLAVALGIAAFPQLIQAQEALGPGDQRIDGRALKPGRWTMETTVTRDGQAPQSIHGEWELREIVVQDQPAWQLIQTVRSPRGTMTDTAIVLAAGLQPVRHRGHAPTRYLELDFAGTVVTGRVAANGAAPEPFRRETAEPTFDSSVLDLVLAAAPLSTGFRARVPMYIHEQNGLVWHDVAVKGEETVERDGRQIPAWRVEVSTPVFQVTYLIGKNREPLGVIATSNSTSFHMVLNRVD